MQFILLIFILVPIIEIGVFFQVGNIIGLPTTLFIVLITAIIGVRLLKQQGLRAWTDIQLKMAQGEVPALEMAAAAQLLFAGGLLLTPGFVTDALGFALMFPEIRLVIAKRMYQSWSAKKHTGFQSFNQNQQSNKNQQFHQSDPFFHAEQKKSSHQRIIEGEFEDKSKKNNENSDS